MSSPSDEMAQVIWASHILSYLNPHTIFAPKEDAPQTDLEEPADTESTSVEGGEGKADSEGDVDFDEDDVTEAPTIFVETLSSDNSGEKFLNCISELLAHTKGGRYVTASALREGDDSFQVDVARNYGLDDKDKAYLDRLSSFLALQSRLYGPEDENTDAVQQCHTFIIKTIRYNSSRLDHWINDAIKLVGSTITPNDPATGTDQSHMSFCVLGCCQDGEVAPETSEAVLDLLKHIRSMSMPLSKAQQDRQRCQIVRLASLVTKKLDVTIATLGSTLPPGVPGKIMKLWSKLARPVANLRILARIAREFPKFQHVTFIPIEPPEPIKLLRSQVPTIQKAWKYLGLRGTLKRGLPPKLLKRGGAFKTDCTRELPSHCEIQLLTRYENDPNLVPTLDYFGCSKKACYLCYTFLSYSRLRPRVRGHHGTCYPLWGVPQSASEAVRPQLEAVRSELINQIELVLDPSSDISPRCIEESSVVSDLKTSDLERIRQLSIIRKAREREASEYRENGKLLLHPRSISPGPVPGCDIRQLCAICQKVKAKPCSGCYAIRYCSARCQKVDWPSHKILCSSYLDFLDTRPSDRHTVAIFFPLHETTPKLIWVSSLMDIVKLLGPDDEMIHTCSIIRNGRRGFDIARPLTAFYKLLTDDYNQSLLKAIEASQYMTLSTYMWGNYVITNPSLKDDVMLDDFRYALDENSEHGNSTIRDEPSSDRSVMAIKINSPREQAQSGQDEFVAVAVDGEYHSHPSKRSDIMLLLGQEVRVAQVSDREVNPTHGLFEGSSRNKFTEILTVNPNNPEDRKSPEDGGFAPYQSILLIHPFGRHLDLGRIKYMCEYCLGVLQPLYDRFRADEIRLSDVLAEITPEKMIAWKPNEWPGSGKETEADVRAGDGAGSRVFDDLYNIASYEKYT